MTLNIVRATHDFFESKVMESMAKSDTWSETEIATFQFLNTKLEVERHTNKLQVEVAAVKAKESISR